MQNSQPFWREWGSALHVQPDALYEPGRAQRSLKEAYHWQSLEPLGDITPALTTACGALVAYLRTTQKTLLNHLTPPHIVQQSGALRMDGATLRNLEVLQKQSGGRAGSLLAAIDRTVTAPGARLLAERLAAPLTALPEIQLRQAEVQGFLDAAALRSELRATLRHLPDIARALSRLALMRGGPRDVLAIGQGLCIAGQIAQILTPMPDIITPLQGHEALADTLTRAFVDPCPVQTRDGNFIAEGFHPPLDALRELRRDGKQVIARLQARLAEETGIASLKIKFNNVLGYFIEITQSHAAKVPPAFIHRQTMSGALRYTTVELNELARRIIEAEARSKETELTLLADLSAQVLAQHSAIHAAAQVMARLDVAAALAELAATDHYVKPHLVNEPVFEVTAGRHPVVEQARRKAGESAFIGNDCQMEEHTRLWLLTGPNMAGKSTFLRQNALMIILAQAGAYVPAEAARIGLVDKLFSRVGAADDLARGQSTFMVEMVETAAILHQATKHSFVILDEIGRGTATYDGLSIAWAVVEHLHNTMQCRALFATHYHELTRLRETLPALSCHTMRVREWKGEIIFLHQVAKGAAERSYGIHVARLAGVPAPVLTRATALLKELEASASAAPVAALPLFAVAEEKGHPSGG